jgi:hypothetical protein
VSIGFYFGRASVPTFAEQAQQVRAQAGDLAAVLADAGSAYADGYDDPAVRADAVASARRVNGELGQFATTFAAVDPAGYAAAVTAVDTAAAALAEGKRPPEATPLVAAAVERLEQLAGVP